MPNCLHLPTLLHSSENANSEIEVIAAASIPDMGNTYIVEAKPQDKAPVTVANSVVAPKQEG